ncbi:MAG: hypothetical protein ACYC6Y_11925 [Thermoguttaceae bacterium]
MPSWLASFLDRALFGRAVEVTCRAGLFRRRNQSVDGRRPRRRRAPVLPQAQRGTVGAQGGRAASQSELPLG